MRRADRPRPPPTSRRAPAAPAGGRVVAWPASTERGCKGMLKGSDVYDRGGEHDHGVALAEIYEANFERVWRWAQGFGVRPGDLEDAVQEVFVVAHRRYGEFGHRSQVSTWLFGICMRVAAGFRRRAHVRREAATEDMEPVVTGTAPPPDDALLGRQAGELARRILDGLDEDKRAVFVLHELEELTLKEIAEMLGCPLQTVYSRLAAARKHFREEAERLQQPREDRP